MSLNDYDDLRPPSLLPSPHYIRRTFHYQSLALYLIPCLLTLCLCLLQRSRPSSFS